MNQTGIIKDENFVIPWDSVIRNPVWDHDHDLKTGVCGMASGVMEWTSSMEKDPARVKEPPGPVACGGDWRQPGISNRVEYLRSRGERRDNLGFRIVRNVR